MSVKLSMLIFINCISQGLTGKFEKTNVWSSISQALTYEYQSIFQINFQCINIKPFIYL